jgi:RNA recognition motif-containing protein
MYRYVGNLDSRATESFISDIFSSIGPVKRCKLITGREHLDEAPYCFVEFEDHKTASKAIAAMNGRTIFDKVSSRGRGLRKSVKQKTQMLVVENDSSSVVYGASKEDWR